MRISAAGFIGSPEYYAHSGRTDASRVNAMYLNLLGRPADSAGDAYWTHQLALGANRADVAYGFAASPEEETLRVQSDYQSLLLRSASPADVIFWVNSFTQGVTNENLVAGFIGSDEYFQRAVGN